MNVDPIKSKGFQSMSILHHLGLKREFQGLFQGFDSDEAIELLHNTGSEYNTIAKLIDCHKNKTPHKSISSVDPELESILYLEGKKVEYYTTKYERNKICRDDTVRIHGLKCMACGFNFGEKYGKHGEGYIEVHHVKPLHSRNEEVKIDPVSDLVCLYSNCHRMIHHKKNAIMTIDELKKIIQ